MYLYTTVFSSHKDLILAILVTTLTATAWTSGKGNIQPKGCQGRQGYF